MNPWTVTIKELQKSFGELPVLTHVNMTLSTGQTWVLMGSSGSGKTTLLRLLLGLEIPDCGTISWNTSAPSNGELPKVVAVFQENRLCEEFSAVQNILMVTGKTLTREQIVHELCHLLPAESLHRPVSTLSGGMKRRVAIMRAMLAPSDAVLMDEPFTGLDEGTKQQVILYIKEKAAGKLLLISTHQEEDVALLDAKLITLSL